MSEWTLYWITRLDGINNLFVGISVLAFCLIGIICIWKPFLDIDLEYPSLSGYEVAKKLLPKLMGAIPVLVIVGFLSGSISIFIPKTKEMAMIWVIPKVANSEFIEEITNEFSDVSKMALDKLKDVLEIEDE